MIEFSLRLNLVVIEKYSLALRSQQKADHHGRQPDRLNASNLRESLYHTAAHIVAEIPAFELTLLRFSRSWVTTQRNFTLVYLLTCVFS